MLKILIIEDNNIIAGELENIILENFTDVKLLGKLESVAESIDWFEKTQVLPNLILMDISLSDGDSFSIIRECDITIPIIFITGSENLFTEALRFQGIDYVLKPVQRERLILAIEKYFKLKAHFTNLNPHLKQLTNSTAPLDRIVVKLRSDFSHLKTADIAYFSSEFKAVFAIDKQGRKFLCDSKNLYILEELLNSRQFFRANRKTIINIDYIKSYKIIKRSKIQVEMSIPAQEIIISQENATEFKTWMGVH